jgi:hypothetical protein
MPEKPLSDDELRALKQIGDVRSRSTIPTRVKERLIAKGYAKDVLGSLVITDEGMLRLVMAK